MKIYCLRNDAITTSAEYTINYLLNRCGFFFDWITVPEDIQGEGLLLVYHSEKNQTNIALPVISLRNEFKLSELSDNNIKWNVITLGNEDIPVFIVPDKQDLDNLNIDISSFDLIANVYYHLTRLEERLFKHPDDVDKNAENSILFKHGNFMIPIVDIICDFLKKDIIKKFEENNYFLIRKSYYSEGQSFGIALTHDVDFIRAYHPLKKIFLKILIWSGLKKNITIKDIEQQDNLRWGFDQLLYFYKQINLRATFFFISKYLEGWHFRYRIASKKIRRLLIKLELQNHEIAFHPSRYAFENPKRYLKEKLKLEKISGLTLLGIRHHYIRSLFPKIWQKAHELNLKYDAGMIYRSYSGFRAGTCFSFATFDHTNQNKIDIIEFPTTFFENTLPDKGNDFEASKKTITQLLNTVKKYGGLLNILWHSNNVYQPEAYSKLWDFIINLVNQEDAYKQPLMTHYYWYKLREKIKFNSYDKTENGYTIRISVPDGIHKFSLHVPALYKYKCSSKMVHDPIKNILTIDCDDSNKPISIEALRI